MWKNRFELKVEEAGIATFFGLELYGLFCVGEIVGRGFTFTGYNIWANHQPLTQISGRLADTTSEDSFWELSCLVNYDFNHHRSLAKCD